MFNKTLAVSSEMRFESSFLEFHVCVCWGFESAPFSVLEILLWLSRERGLTQTPVSTVSISCASFGEIVLSRRLASGFKSPMYRGASDVPSVLEFINSYLTGCAALTSCV